MPKMGGVELIQKLRKRNPKVKCLAITGFSDIEVPKGVPLLHKPVSTTMMLESLNKTIQEKYNEKINHGVD